MQFKQNAMMTSWQISLLLHECYSEQNEVSLPCDPTVQSLPDRITNSFLTFCNSTLQELWLHNILKYISFKFSVFKNFDFAIGGWRNLLNGQGRNVGTSKNGQPNSAKSSSLFLLTSPGHNSNIHNSSINKNPSTSYWKGSTWRQAAWIT